MQARLPQNHWSKRRVAAVNNPPAILENDSAEKSNKLENRSVHCWFGPVFAIWNGAGQADFVLFQRYVEASQIHAAIVVKLESMSVASS